MKEVLEEDKTHQTWNGASGGLDANREPGFLGFVDAEQWLLWAQKANMPSTLPLTAIANKPQSVQESSEEATLAATAAHSVVEHCLLLLCWFIPSLVDMAVSMGLSQILVQSHRVSWEGWNLSCLGSNEPPSPSSWPLPVTDPCWV